MFSKSKMVFAVSVTILACISSSSVFAETAKINKSYFQSTFEYSAKEYEESGETMHYTLAGKNRAKSFGVDFIISGKMEVVEQSTLKQVSTTIEVDEIRT